MRRLRLLTIASAIVGLAAVILLFIGIGRLGAATNGVGLVRLAIVLAATAGFGGAIAFVGIERNKVRTLHEIRSSTDRIHARAGAVDERVRRLTERVAALEDSVADAEFSISGADPYLGSTAATGAPPVPDTAVRKSDDDRPIFVLGISTVDRREYLEQCITSFVATRSARFQWLLIVADDGSTDGTLDYLAHVDVGNSAQLVLIENQGARIAGQTNTILLASAALGFDFGLKVDDDVYFRSPGWDELYFDTAKATGVDHLVFHDPAWKRPRHELARPGLHSYVSAEDALGCLYSFTPKMISTIGYLDEVNFPHRGHAHIDYTVRACRAGFNDATTLWDAEGAASLVAMQDRTGYVQTIDLESKAMRDHFTPRERARRRAVIRDESRLYVAPRLDVTSTVRLEPVSPDLSSAISSIPRFSVA